MNKLSTSLLDHERIGGWIYLVIDLFVLPVVLTMANMLLPKPLDDASLNFIFFSINFLCILLIFHRFLGDSFRIAKASPFRCLRSAVVGYVLYYIGNLAMGILMVSLYPNFSNVNDSSIQLMSQDNYILISIGTVFLVPLVEEVLYRGLIFGGLYNRNRIAAYAVSSLVFCAIHVVGYIGFYDPLLLLLCFLQYIPAGLCLGYAYASADTIWAPILLHMAINQMGISAMR